MNQFLNPFLRSSTALALTFLLGSPGPQAQSQPRDRVPGAVLEVQTLGTLAPAAIRGQIARLYARSGLPAVRYPVTRHRIRFVTRDERGAVTTVAASLDVPRMGAGARPPVFVFTPGTTGLADRCAPSKERPAAVNWGDYPANTLSYAAAGIVTITPDYVHFDTPNRAQPYFVSRPEAHVSLDAARAVYRLAREGRLGITPAQSTFIGGYSQGGHSAFAAADLRSSYAPDVPLKGVMGYGGTTDVAALMRESTLFSPYIVAAYRATYGAQKVPLERILSPRGVQIAQNSALRDCVEVITDYPATPSSAYTPAFRQALLSYNVGSYLPEFAALLRQNRPGFSRSAQNVAALLLQGSRDTIVYPATQRSFRNGLCAAGRRVKLLEYAGVNHYQTRQFAFADAVSWMVGITAGKAAPSDCR